MFLLAENGRKLSRFQLFTGPPEVQLKKKKIFFIGLNNDYDSIQKYFEIATGEPKMSFAHTCFACQIKHAIFGISGVIEAKILFHMGPNLIHNSFQKDI